MALTKCKSDEFHVLAPSFKPGSNTWIVLPCSWSTDSRPGEWVCRRKNSFEELSSDKPDKPDKPEGIIVGVLLPHQVGDHDPYRFVILWFK